MTNKQKRYQNADEYPGDRITITVHKGYRRLYKLVARERNSDVSKIAREALEMWFNANNHTLSDKAKRERDELKRAHADSRWSELL